MNMPRAVAMLLLVGVASLGGGCATTAVSNATPKQFLPDQIVVTLPAESRANWDAIARQLADQYGLTLAGQFELASIDKNCIIYAVPPDRSVAATLQALSEDPRIDLAERNQIFEAQQTAAATDSYAGLSYAPTVMQATAAHAHLTGRGVLIAVIDTGADVDHPELANSIEGTENFVERGESTFNSDLHGTAVSGLIGAAVDHVGIDGIAPDARLLVIKSCWYSPSGKTQCSSWSLAKAIDSAVRKRANVINLSLAGPYDKVIAELLANADRRQIAIVAATLSNADTPGFPAELDFVIPAVATGAGARPVQRAWRRLNGYAAAPGIDIVVPVPHDQYRILSGTSFAAAHISGAIALLKEADRKLTPEQLKTLLVGASHDAAAADAVPIKLCRLIDQLGDNSDALDCKH